VTKLQDLRDAVFMHGPEHFYMHAWFCEPNDEGQMGNSDPYTPVDLTRCGTAACLAGHGAVVMTQQGLMDRQRLDLGWMQDVANYFELPMEAFHTSDWHKIVLSDGTTLEERYNREQLDGVLPLLERTMYVQWTSMLDYLDDRIKQEMNNE
jgi:hypothetical protein